MNYIKRLLLSLLLLLGSIHTQAENNPVTGNKAPVSVPTVYISGQRGTDGSTFVVTFNFSEAVTGFDATAVSMSGWTNLTATNPTGGPKVYTMTVACPANTVATLNVTLLANKVKSAGGQLNSQSFNATFTIDNVQPVVEAVIAPYARNYRTGDEIHFRVFFSKQVFASVAGQVPGLPITVGSRQTEALFSGGIGDNSLFFSYKVQSGDRDLNGVEVGTSLNIPPHSLNDTYGNELLPTLAGIENTSEVLVNATSPACSVTQLSGGSQVNGPFQVRVSFTEAVTGFTAASMALTNATVTSFAAEDQFNYLLTIKPDGDGAVSVYVPADVAMNDGPNGNLISNQIDVTADVTIPTITQLDVPAPGKYGTSNTLEFTVHFSENVNVNTRNGVPTLKLNIGGTVVDADFMGISGTDTWSFSYQIKDGDMDLDGIELGAGISLNGATIRDGARNNANVTFPGTVDVSGIKISTVRPTVVLSSTAPEWVNNPITVYADFSEAVTGITTASFQVYRMIVDEVTTTDNIHFVLTVSPTFNGPLSITLPADQGLNQYSTGNTASDPLTRTGDFLDPKLLTLDVPSNGAYGINSTLTFTAHYNEIVLVNTTNGTPYMAINSGINGGTTKVLRALYSGGSGTDAISFTYTVQEGDADPDGISLGAGISFGGGGLMTDRAGNIARLVLPANNVSGITINTTRPTVTLSTTAPAILKDPFTVTAVFSEVVNGLTAAAFTLVNATASNLQTSDYITYTMTITPSADGAVSILLPANIVHSTLQNGNIASNQVSVTADLTAPTITSVDLPVDRYYNAGEKLTFVAHFSENVVINASNGAYSLPVVISGGNVSAGYTGVFTANTMTFSYTIQDGDMAMNGLSFGTALSGTGSETIRDPYGNDAVLTLPANMDGSHIFINTVSPGVTLSTGAGGLVDRAFTITITFTEKVFGFTTGDFLLTNATISTLQSSDDITYTALITPIASGPVAVSVPANVATNIGRNGNTAAPAAVNVSADLAIPAVTQVAVPADGYYNATRSLNFTVTYNKVVTVVGVPSLRVTVGAKNADAVYTGGSGTNTLTFAYAIQPGDNDMNGIVLAANMELNSGTIKDRWGKDALLPLNNVASTANVFVNTQHPSVSLSTAAAATVGKPFTVTAVFSEVVTGLTASAFTLQNATASTLQSADGITYTVLITPAATGAVTVSLPADVAVNIGRNGNTAAPAAVNVTADLTIPAVTQVLVPTDGYYNATQSLSFTVTYNKVVTVVGTPSLRVTVGVKNVDAVYTGGSGTNTLTFVYAIQPGDNDMNGIALAASIQLNTGSIRDQWSNDALLPLNNVASTANVFVNTQHPSVLLSTAAAATVGKPFTMTAIFSEAVTGLTASAFTLQNATASTLQSADGITYTVLITPAATGAVTVSLPADVAVNIGRNGNTAAPAAVNVTADLTIPAVTQVLVPTDGYYNATQSLSVTVTYNKVVTVVGTPSLRITIGAKTADAVYTGGSGTNALTFAYAIQQGDNDMNGIALAASIQLNAGSIRDQWSNDALLPLNNVASTANVFVNTQHPSVLLSTAAAATVGKPFTMTAIFSEAVTGLTASAFTLQNATASTLQSADGITYTVLITPAATGQVTISLPADVAVNVGRNGNTAAPAAVNVTADLTIPAVTLVAVPADGYYNATQSLSFTVTYNKVVTVVGTPSLRITIGAKTADAVYTVGSGTNTLTFAYAIQPGDNDMNGIALAASIQLNTGSIRDQWANDALLPLNNVASTANVFVNTQHPSVSLSTAAAATVGKPFTVTAVFSEVVTGLTASAFTLQNATASTLQSADGITYTVLITPAATGPVTVSLPAEVAVNIGRNGNSAAPAAVNVTADLTIPAVTRVLVPTDGYYNATQSLSFTVTYNKVVTVVGTPSLRVTVGVKNVDAIYIGGSGTTTLTFVYAIQPGDNDMNGVALAASIQLNAGSIRDQWANDALLPLNNVASTNRVFVNTTQPGVVLSTFAGAIVKAPFTVTATFTEVVTGVTTTDFVTSNATVSDLLTTDQITYTILVSPVADGPLSITLPAAIAVNIAQNPNTAANTIQLSVSTTPPVVNQPPVMDPVPAQQICSTTEAQSLQLTGASPVETGQTLSYFIAADQPYFNSLTVSNTGLVSYSLKTGISGAVNISIIIKDNGGTANGGVDSLQRNFTLTVNPLPVISISSDKGTATFKGDIVLLTATGGNTYTWANADGIISGQQEAALKVKMLANTTFQVAAVDANGCGNTAKISISVNDDFKVKATNILTPNGDGKNDKWIVQYLEAYPDNEVSIYDRLGRLVYQRRNYSNDWDGTMNGTPLAEGTYYYIINIKENNRVVKGFITLLRDR